MAHEHGSMDIKAQEKTFEGFAKWLTWGTIVSLVALIFVGLLNA